MNSVVIGLISGLVIAVGSIFFLSKDPSIFVDWIGLAIVIGGTASAATVTFSFKELKILIATAISVLRKPLDDSPELLTSIITLAQDCYGNNAALGNALPNIKYSFLREALELVVNQTDPARMQAILSDKIESSRKEAALRIKMLKTLGKYPPAFGMVGTVIGLIAVLQELGGSLQAKDLGPAMAVGLTTTLYGLLLSNQIIIPMSEKLELSSEIDLKKRELVCLAAEMFRNSEPPVLMQEALNALLPTTQRRDVLGLGTGQGRAA